MTIGLSSSAIWVVTSSETVEIRLAKLDGDMLALVSLYAK